MDPASWMAHGMHFYVNRSPTSVASHVSADRGSLRELCGWNGRGFLGAEVCPGWDICSEAHIHTERTAIGEE